MGLKERLPHDIDRHALQVPKPTGTSQDVSFDGSVQSSAVDTDTQAVRLCATKDCRYKIAADPTATATSVLLPANVIEYVEVEGGQKIAAIKEATAGKLNIVECE